LCWGRRWLSGEKRSAQWRIQSYGRLLRGRFVLGHETFKLGQTVALSHQPSTTCDPFELCGFNEAPGAVDEVHAFFAA